MKEIKFNKLAGMLLLAVGLMLGVGVFIHSFFSQAGYSSLSGTSTASWTVMIYLNGDNEMERAAVDDFLEMATVGSTADVNVVVQFDRIGVYDDRYGDWSDARRFHVTAGMTPYADNAVDARGEINMADPAELADFICWAKTEYPADNYALVIWGRGSGWRKTKDDLWREKMARKKEEARFKAVSWDDSSSRDCLYTSEIKSALNSAGGVELIGFDSDYMAMVEVAYEVKDYGRVLVGSEDIDPGDGWPYDTILFDLTYKPSLTPSALGTIIVDRFQQFHGEHGGQSAIDLSRMNSLAGAIDTFARAMIDHWNNDKKTVRAAAQTVMDEIDSAVISEKHGDVWCSAHGLAIYFPASLDVFNTDYNGSVIDFPAYTAWDEFLREFFDSMIDSWINRRLDLTQRFSIHEHIDLYHFCENLKLVPANYYTERQPAHTFIGGGTPQDFHCDDLTLCYYLPDNFYIPFFKDRLSYFLEISSNGYIDIYYSQSGCQPWGSDYANSSSKLYAVSRIAPCWTDLITYGSAQPGEDIYITQNADNIVVRWVAETYREGIPVNFEAVLFTDGRIQFNYGSGNSDISPWDTPPTIGISRGDRVNGYLAAYNGCSSLTEVDSIRFRPICKLALDVIGPTDGETFAAGTYLPIEWTTGCIYSGTFRLTLWKADNSSSILIDDAALLNFHSIYYDYLIPCDTAPGPYFVSVKHDKVGDRSGVFNIIPPAAPFSIHVTAPSGGTYNRGDNVTAAWNTSAPASGTVAIELHNIRYGHYYTLDEAAPIDSSPRTYLIPCGFITGNAYIKVAQGSICGRSADIAIIGEQPCLIVISPEGGDIFLIGDRISIEWYSSGVSGSVSIHLVKSDGSATYLVAGSVPYNSQPYTYTIPTTVALGTYVIRIKQGETTLGESGLFTINR